MSMDLFKGSGYSGPGKKHGGLPRRNRIIEKNYFFINSDQLPNIDLRETAAGGAVKTYFGKLLLTVTALQDLFLGSGEIKECNKRLYDDFSYLKKEAGHPVKTFNLPGSSMKGCILTNLYLFLNECSTGFFSPSTKKNSDDMAKVFFSDFPIVNVSESKPQTIPGRFKPQILPPERTRLKMYRKDDRAYGNLTPDELRKLQAKENILTVKKGSRFRGFINFKLLSLHELLFLLLSLGCFKDHHFYFKVGGAKNRGMGVVKMELDMDKSYYANEFKELSLRKQRRFRELEPGLISELAQLKQRYSRIHNAVKIMQDEYGGAS